MLVLESGVIGGEVVSSLVVENWPGYEKISWKELMDKIYHQVNNLNVEVRYEEVVSVKKTSEKQFLVKTDEGEYSCGAIIVATDTEPRRLSEKQEKDAGSRPVSYCATCDGALYKGKIVVVVGSGNTAKQEMKYLEGICAKVYHIHHDDPIPEDAEAVFVAIGRVPATDVFKSLVNLDEKGYVVAGEDCKTSCGGVFVAGDSRTKSVRQLVTAAADGAVPVSGALDYLGK